MPPSAGSVAEAACTPLSLENAPKKGFSGKSCCLPVSAGRAQPSSVNDWADLGEWDAASTRVSTRGGFIPARPPRHLSGQLINGRKVEGHVGGHQRRGLEY